MSSKSAPPQKPTTGGNAARTTERRKERERERRRNRMIAVVVVVVVLAALAATALILANMPSDATLPPDAVARYQGVTQTHTAEGYPRLGDGTIPVQVALYSSFDCTACRTLHEEIMGDLIQRVRDGQIAVTFVPLYGTGSITNGRGAARAAMCADQQDGFWPYQDALFFWQGRDGNQAFTESRLKSGIRELGLDQGAYEVCARSGTPDEVLNSARTSAAALLNFVGTPTVTINGVTPVDENAQPISGAPALLVAIDRAIEANANRGVRPTVEPAATPAIESTPEVTAEATATS